MIAARRRSWRPGRRGVKRRQSDERQRVSRDYSGAGLLQIASPATNDGSRRSGVTPPLGKYFLFPLLDHRQSSSPDYYAAPRIRNFVILGKLFHHSIMAIFEELAGNNWLANPAPLA